MSTDLSALFRDLQKHADAIAVGLGYLPQKPAGEDFTDVKAAMFDFGVDKTTPAPEPKGDLWEVAIKDTYNSVVEIRADKVQFGIVGIESHDIGFTAYLDGTEVFHTPSGAYHYARKVV